MPRFDVAITAGRVVDGTGAPARTADIGIKDGIVSEVGRIDPASAERTIDADGAVVAPGFVDIHTHYDGQATWDERLAPSSWHGVTTVVMGNCGVGFAPVREPDRQRLIELMEGVEDIPGAALHEGLSWEWSSFADYLDALETRPHDIDFAAQVPHGAVRLYVMGERGAAREPATPDEISEMAEITRAAVAAGALGFTTSRTLNHRTSRGEPTPTLTASADELAGIASGLGAEGAGVLQVVSDFLDTATEIPTVMRMAEESGRPLSISIAEADMMPGRWRELLASIADANGAGLEVRGQVAVRAIGAMLGLSATLNPFMTSPAYRELADLPLEERVMRMRDPEVRTAILEGSGSRRFIGNYERLFVLGDPPDYEPDPSASVAARAVREGRDPADLAYDLLLEDGGKTLLYSPFLNYANGDLSSVREMLLDEHTVPGLGDGGAHVGTICDGSFPTTLLTHWCRDRSRGEGLPLEFVIRRQCRETAATVGLRDRGVLAPGYKADVNVIDFERLTLRPPEIHYDLPAGGKRLLQRAEGYKHTLVSGREIYRDGVATDDLPGRLVRGAQPAPVG